MGSSRIYRKFQYENVQSVYLLHLFNNDNNNNNKSSSQKVILKLEDVTDSRHSIVSILMVIRYYNWGSSILVQHPPLPINRTRPPLCVISCHPCRFARYLIF